jgi:hypothetical protein
MENVKPWYLSKMVLVNMLAGVVMILVQFQQLAGIADFLKVHFAEAGLGWAVLNAALRFISKDKISII